MLNATRYAKAAISLLLLFGVSGYPLSIINGDTVVNKGSCRFSVDRSSTSGYEMYTNYCAGCHGEDGRGKGRSSRYCTVPPADLTQLDRKNHGSYSPERVCQILRYGTGRPPKGQGYMPIWGLLLRSMNVDPPDVTEIRIHNLAEYVKILQDTPAVPYERRAVVK